MPSHQRRARAQLSFLTDDYAQFDGFRFIIRCTPRKVVFFAIVGPPGSTQERNQIAQDLFDRIKKGFLSESSAR